VHTEALVEKALRRVLRTRGAAGQEHSVTGIVVATGRRPFFSRTGSRCFRTAHHTRRHTFGTPRDGAQYRYLLAADDELDDGVERACAWEDDENRNRLGQAIRSGATERACEPGTVSSSPARPRADDRDRHHRVDIPEDPDEQPVTLARPLRRRVTICHRRGVRAGARHARCSARCCGLSVAVAFLAVIVVVENAARCRFASRAAWHRPRHPPIIDGGPRTR